MRLLACVERDRRRPADLVADARGIADEQRDVVRPEQRHVDTDLDRYSRARDEMFEETDTGFAPWYVVRSNDKRRARLNLISHLLDHIPYKTAPREKVKFPKRQKRHGYREPDYPYKYVKERY